MSVLVLPILFFSSIEDTALIDRWRENFGFLKYIRNTSHSVPNYIVGSIITGALPIAILLFVCIFVPRLFVGTS